MKFILYLVFQLITKRTTRGKKIISTLKLKQIIVSTLKDEINLLNTWKQEKQSDNYILHLSKSHISKLIENEQA